MISISDGCKRSIIHHEYDTIPYALIIVTVEQFNTALNACLLMCFCQFMRYPFLELFTFLISLMWIKIVLSLTRTAANFDVVYGRFASTVTFNASMSTRACERPRDIFRMSRFLERKHWHEKRTVLSFTVTFSYNSLIFRVVSAA